MKLKEFSENSWHCKLAKMGGHSSYGLTNICEYTQRVIFGMLAYLLIAVGLFSFTFLAGAVTGALIYDIGSSLFFLEFNISDYGLIGLALYSVGGFTFVVYQILSGNWKFKRENQNKEPGFLKQSYLAHKNKYCFELRTVSDSAAAKR